VHVRAYDAAGNHADGATTFFVNEVTPSHGWILNGYEGGETTFADVPGASPPVDLVQHGASWVDDGPHGGVGLHVDGTADTMAGTSSTVIDPTRSFSIAVAVRQTTPGIPRSRLLWIRAIITCSACNAAYRRTDRSTRTAPGPASRRRPTGTPSSWCTTRPHISSGSPSTERRY
jgi:hypothetical protein